MGTLERERGEGRLREGAIVGNGVVEGGRGEEGVSNGEQFGGGEVVGGSIGVVFAKEEVLGVRWRGRRARAQ